MSILHPFSSRVGLIISLALSAANASAATVEYIHTDALGSIVAISDASRNVIERREYEPFGEQLTPVVQNGPGYTGHVQDATTGLTYMQQRFYEPGVGRFLSVDPVTADAETGENFNRYWYANGNPYRYLDPDGRKPQDKWYGHDDPAFRDWVHDEKRVLGRRNDFTQGELDEYQKDYDAETKKPRGKGGRSSRGGSRRGQGGAVKIGLLARLNIWTVAAAAIFHSPGLNEGHDEELREQRQAEEEDASGEGDESDDASDEPVKHVSNENAPVSNRDTVRERHLPDGV